MARNQGKLALSFGSLCIGALTLATMLGIITSVNTFFAAESRELLGGDIVVEKSTPFAVSEVPNVAELVATGANVSRRIETLAVLQHGGAGLGAVGAGAADDSPSSVLVSLKAVDGSYPLYGELDLVEYSQDDDGSFATPSPNMYQLPMADEVLVANDVLIRLGAKVGDTVGIGQAQYRISNVIEQEPDRLATGFRLGPTVIISMSGWERAGIRADRSRAQYILSIKYGPTTPLALQKASEQAIKTFYQNSSGRSSNARDGSSTLSRVLDSASRFFFTIIVLALFLVVVNIRINLTYFLASFRKTIAIVRSVGMRKRTVVALFFTILTMISLAAGILGTLLGNVLVGFVLPYVEGIVERSLPHVALGQSMGVVTMFTVLLCIFSALSFFARIMEVEPKSLLGGYGEARTPRATLFFEGVAFTVTLLALFAGVWFLTERVKVAAIAVASIAAVFGALFFGTKLGLAILYRRRAALQTYVRFIVSFLHRGGFIATTVVASLTIALSSLFAIILVQRNVLANIATDFRADAPNLYALDIQEDQRAGVAALMGPDWKDFSVVRGRFITRDGVQIQERLDSEDPELAREFNLTSRSTLIDGERVISGTYHGEAGKGEVSVEKDFAARAKIKLGSTLTFSVQGFPITARVTSIREVVTTNGLPFFFLVYSEDVLAAIPKNYFGYTYANEADIPRLQATLARTYPNVSTIPTAQIIATVTKVVTALGAAVAGTAVPALVLGILHIVPPMLLLG
jgi:putative ABC transport system permease protein